MAEMNEFGKLTPCYVYDASMITDACRELKQAFPDFEFLYSIKTNPFAPVVRTIAAEGFGADAASANEVDKALAAGMPAGDVYFSAPGRTPEDIRRTMGRCVLAADSLHEIRMIDATAAELGRTEEIGIRVHPLFNMDGGAAGTSKFGIDLEQMEELKSTIASCSHIRVTGIHVHLRSQNLDTGLLARYYENVMKMALDLQQKLGVTWKFINFGSGIGVVYDRLHEEPVDLAVLGAAAARIAAMNTGHARLLIETGRFPTCHSGCYYTPVVDKKVSHGTTYLVVRNGLNGFIRPGMASILQKTAGTAAAPMMEPYYTNAGEFEVRVLSDSEEKETVTICGNLCTGLDVIAEHIELPKAEIGDIIEITNAGSYACTLSSLLFSSHDLPGEYLLTEDGSLVTE